MSRISPVPRGILVASLLVGVLDSLAATDGKIDRFVSGEMELNGIPGLSLVIVESGTVAYLKAYGVRSIQSQEAMRTETPVELASLSKALTALAVLRLERDGLVERDSSVTALLPDLDRARWQGVTIRNLLQHRSGLRRKHDFLMPCCGQPGQLNLSGAAPRFAGADLKSPPGERSSYANSNYVLLAAIVQRASGTPFPKFMRKEIFQPLGMDRTTVDEGEAQSWGEAAPHEWQWGRVGISPSRFVGWYGSSLVKASATDMSKYMEALLDPQPADNGTRLPHGAWWELLEGNYDLGWAVQAEAEWLGGEYALEHTGKMWGGSTAIVLAPRRRNGVAVLANLGSSRAGPMARAILRSLEGSPLPRPERISRGEIPDTWAMIFLASSVGVLLVILGRALSVGRQIRRGARTWRPTIWRSARAVVLGGLAVFLIHGLLWGTDPPREALPTTIRTALPALVASVIGLLLLAAVTGLVPKRGRQSEGARHPHPW